MLKPFTDKTLRGRLEIRNFSSRAKKYNIKIFGHVISSIYFTLNKNTNFTSSVIVALVLVQSKYFLQVLARYLNGILVLKIDIWVKWLKYFAKGFNRITFSCFVWFTSPSKRASEECYPAKRQALYNLRKTQPHSQAPLGRLSKGSGKTENKHSQDSTIAAYEQRRV